MFLSDFSKEEYRNSTRLISQLGRLHRLWEVKPAPPLRRGDLVVLGALHHLEWHGERDVNASRLAKMMHQSMPGISQRLAEMEAQGTIRRKTDKTDRRVATIKLTDKGRRIVEQNTEAILGRVEQALDTLGEQDTETLLRLAEKLGDALYEAYDWADDTTPRAQGEDTSC